MFYIAKVTSFREALNFIVYWDAFPSLANRCTVWNLLVLLPSLWKNILTPFKISSLSLHRHHQPEGRLCWGGNKRGRFLLQSVNIKIQRASLREVGFQKIWYEQAFKNLSVWYNRPDEYTLDILQAATHVARNLQNPGAKTQVLFQNNRRSSDCFHI